MLNRRHEQLLGQHFQASTLSLSLFSIPGFSSFQLYILPMFYKQSLKKKKVIVKQEENASGH